MPRADQDPISTASVVDRVKRIFPEMSIDTICRILDELIESPTGSPVMRYRPGFILKGHEGRELPQGGPTQYGDDCGWKLVVYFIE